MEKTLGAPEEVRETIALAFKFIGRSSDVQEAWARFDVIKTTISSTGMVQYVENHWMTDRWLEATVDGTRRRLVGDSWPTTNNKTERALRSVDDDALGNAPAWTTYLARPGDGQVQARSGRRTFPRWGEPRGTERNRERLQPPERKRPAFLSLDDDTVFSAHCEENYIQPITAVPERDPTQDGRPAPLHRKRPRTGGGWPPPTAISLECLPAPGTPKARSHDDQPDWHPPTAGQPVLIRLNEERKEREKPCTDADRAAPFRCTWLKPQKVK
ncbi:hypothetical protein Bbelb_350830 [Branchiostoma belcheri]|nr:hypothetical protein Bbelb_350830 [Branchiostoma belcheri]